jgi:hypothetical protein
LRLAAGKNQKKNRPGVSPGAALFSYFSLTRYSALMSTNMPTMANQAIERAMVVMIVVLSIPLEAAV